tara:strand:- start:859 stop:1005 length:147 start_codon:yes stop_codon:yes gene_type:complete
MVTERGFYVRNGLFRKWLAEINSADFSSKYIAEWFDIQRCLMSRSYRV